MTRPAIEAMIRRSGVFYVMLAISVGIQIHAAEEMIQPRRLVDMQTAGALPKATFDFETRIYPSGDTSITGGGLSIGIAVGITDRLNIGLSYGGDGLVGRGKARPNPYPGAFIKYRIIEESYVLPAFAIGYDHQGFGGIESNHSFVYKSQGFFVSASKNYLLFTKLNLGFHGGVNYSLEDTRNVKWPNGWVGLDLGINSELALQCEYDLALNDRDPGADTTYANPIRGFLNAGLRWAFTSDLFIEFLAKDLLQNKVDAVGNRLGWSRELKLVYVHRF